MLRCRETFKNESRRCSFFPSPSCVLTSSPIFFGARNRRQQWRGPTDANGGGGVGALQPPPSGAAHRSRSVYRSKHSGDGGCVAVLLYVCLHVACFCPAASLPLPRAARPPPFSKEGQCLPLCSANCMLLDFHRLAGSAVGFVAR